jgi:hypothetical protein
MAESEQGMPMVRVEERVTGVDQISQCFPRLGETSFGLRILYNFGFVVEGVESRSGRPPISLRTFEIVHEIDLYSPLANWAATTLPANRH